MKKFVLIAAALAAFFAAGCNTYDVTSNKVGYGLVADIAVKDYEVVGVISLESQEENTWSPLRLFHEQRGSRIVWSDLMEEAKTLGADDVINVRIEMTNTNDHIPAVFEFFTGYRDVWKFRATALAVKYTNAVERVKSGMPHDLSNQDSK